MTIFCGIRTLNCRTKRATIKWLPPEVTGISERFLAITALVGASCTPMARDGGSKSQKAEACMTKIFIVGMWNGIISIVTDVIVFVIPIPIIIQIQLQSRVTDIYLLI